VLAVADAGPPHYLVLIEAIDLLPRLFTTVLVPEAVCRELDHVGAPRSVRGWIDHPPPWLEVVPADTREPPAFPGLDVGEREALALAISRRADVVLIDDRRGAAVARAHGLVAIGTLGLLDQGARRGVLDFATAVARLTATNFRYPRELLDRLLAEHGGGGG
jgi:predicted nucleic acid-binding protein